MKGFNELWVPYQNEKYLEFDGIAAGRITCALKRRI